ncbi:hypothetical protein GCM10009603_48670 [Nocardiopsis exhalans]
MPLSGVAVPCFSTIPTRHRWDRTPGPGGENGHTAAAYGSGPQRWLVTVRERRRLRVAAISCLRGRA